MRLVLVGLLFLLMLILQTLHAGFPSSLGARAALAFGFLLLTGFLIGEMIAKAVPRITGYLLTGMAIGPHLLGLVDAEVVNHFSLVDKLALVLIAFTAGGELRLDRLRQRARGIVSIAVIQTAVVFIATTAALWGLRFWLPLFENLGIGPILAIAGTLGIIATATSPSTAVAVIVETRSRGPITDSVLGATVLKDVLVLTGFSLVMAAALPHFSNGDVAHHAGPPRLVLNAALSLTGGGLFGLLMMLYLRFVGKQLVLFVLGSAFLLISLAHGFGLDELLMAVGAGFVVGNFSRRGTSFLYGLERASGPVFLIFFCLAGAGLDLAVLASLWRVALVYIGLRAGFIWLGTWLGAKAVGEDDRVRRFAWTGFIGQAGVSLGLAALVRTQMPQVGGAVADLIVGGIVVNQILGPVAFRWALVRSGEGSKNY